MGAIHVNIPTIFIQSLVANVVWQIKENYQQQLGFLEVDLLKPKYTIHFASEFSQKLSEWGEVLLCKG